jgi:carbonic anhydrase
MSASADFAHTTASDAVLRNLMAGNKRFASGAAQHSHQSTERRAELASGQNPQAVVLSCSDSRVPTEIILDQGLGDIFTVRTAGEILDTAVLASLDFAVEGLGVPLLFVLGHENCGTIAATEKTLTGNITVGGSQGAILEQVGLSIREAQNTGADSTAEYERHHARRIAGEILKRSVVVSAAVANGTLGIAVGRYLVSTGNVEIL